MENSRFKFRVWNTATNKMINNIKEMGVFALQEIYSIDDFLVIPTNKKYPLMQYTGLKDKNGVEIYEYMEIDNLYEVSFLNACYILTNISNGDIIALSDYVKEQNGKIEVTREYTKI